MIRLYDNPFSPFTRKVRLVLAHKGLAFESLDALALDQHAGLLRANPRGEVPVLDAIVHDVSIWTWPTHRRTDAPPAGLLEAGRRDLTEIAGRIEASLGESAFLCGSEPSIADFALFPHLSSYKPLGVVLRETQHARMLAWNRRMRALPVVRDDLAAVKRMAFERFGSGASPYEAVKIVWRGDRLEWLFANGFEAWWAEELRAGRAVVPSWRTTAQLR